MKRVLACLFLLCLTGCGSGHASGVGPARPVANVLVYAKASPPYNPSSPESVWRATVDGGHPHLVAKDSTAPSVSPDGRWIAYDRGGNIVVERTVGGKPRIVYHDGEFPAWAPDSHHIGLLTSSGIVIVDIRTGRQTTIEAASVVSMSFSPDSKRVVYETDSRSGDDLYVASIEGGRPVRITADRDSFDPVWGPPGIAFVRFTHGPSGDIWLTGPRPKDARRLTHTGDGFYPAFFSADGKELLAADPAMHNGRLWAVDVPSGDARPLTPWVGDLFPQGLSRDGKTVLASIGCGGMIGPYGVVETIPFAGGEPHVIVRGPCRASWNAG